MPRQARPARSTPPARTAPDPGHTLHELLVPGRLLQRDRHRVPRQPPVHPAVLDVTGRVLNRQPEQGHRHPRHAKSRSERIQHLRIGIGEGRQHPVRQILQFGLVDRRQRITSASRRSASTLRPLPTGARSRSPTRLRNCALRRGIECLGVSSSSSSAATSRANSARITSAPRRSRPAMNAVVTDVTFTTPATADAASTSTDYSVGDLALNTHGDHLCDPSPKDPAARSTRRTWRTDRFPPQPPAAMRCDSSDAPIHIPEWLWMVSFVS